MFVSEIDILILFIIYSSCLYSFIRMVSILADFFFLYWKIKLVWLLSKQYVITDIKRERKGIGRRRSGYTIVGLKLCL